MKHSIDENDLQQIFTGSTKKKSNTAKKVFTYLGTFVAIFAVTFIIVNFQSLYNIVDYWYKTDIKIENGNSGNYTAEIISSAGVKSNVPKDKLPTISDNHILIPKINVDSPINWNVINTEPNVQKALETGVAGLSGTAVPGESGNVFITGHSSNYFWAKGRYKNIFSLLNKLVVGDLIYVKYKNKLYIYRASNVKVVKPTDISVLSKGDKSVLTLMTCTPVGTSLNRLIITAEQTDPDPSNNLNSNKQAPTSLPKGTR